jgi:hypothetical protein
LELLNDKFAMTNPLLGTSSLATQVIARGLSLSKPRTRPTEGLPDSPPAHLATRTTRTSSAHGTLTAAGASATLQIVACAKYRPRRQVLLALSTPPQFVDHTA